MTVNSEKPAAKKPGLPEPDLHGDERGTALDDAGDVAPILQPLAPTPSPKARSSRRRLGRGLRDTRFFVRQLAFVALSVAVYFGVRHLTEGDVVAAARNAHWLIDLERSLGMYIELQLQQALLGVNGMVQTVNFIYIWAHWPVIIAVLIWLAWRHREAFFVYRNALLLSGLVGMVIVATFPVAPPRLLDLGFIDTVTVHSEAYRVMQPPSLTNQYAAMPSFHAGWDLLMGIALVRYSSRLWLRAIGSALPLLMLFSIVLTGNHFIIDAIVGDAIVLAALALSYWFQKRRSASKDELRSSRTNVDEPRRSGRRDPMPSHD